MHEKIKYSWSIEKSKDNFDIIRINDKYIHSKFNPANEALNIIYPDKCLILIFGLGFAYHVNNLIKNNNNSTFIIFEPHDEIFEIGKKYLHIEENLKNNVLILNCIDNQLIYNFIQSNNFITDNRIKTYSNLGYKSLYPDEEVIFFNSIKKNIELIVQNTLTESAFIPLWTKNILYNFKKISQNPILLPVKKELNENIAVIISAGPNLLNDIEVLKKNREKITIFAVDTALKTLFHNKIIPDFAVSLDGQFYSIDDFVKNGFEKCSFIFDLASFPKISKLYDTVFLSVTDNIFDSTIISFLFKNFNLPKMGISTGGNVSDYSLSLASLLGFKNIYFSGLDLSYPDLQTHAKHSPFYERFYYSSNFFKTLETQTLTLISNRNLNESESRDGKKILTDFVLSNYSYYFSSFAENSKDLKIFYQDAHALKIENFIPVKLDELISKNNSKRINKDDLINKSRTFTIDERKIKDFYEELQDKIYFYAEKLKTLLENTDFESNFNLEKWKTLTSEILTSFPFFKKFIIMSDIILEKKEINENNILYYKHTGHKILQSTYFIIRILKKINSIKNE